MSTLLVKNIRAIVSCDGKDSVYENANLFCKDGLIEYIGPEVRDADKVIEYAKMRNPDIEIIFISAKTGEGIAEVANWVTNNVRQWINE